MKNFVCLFLICLSGFMPLNAQDSILKVIRSDSGSVGAEFLLTTRDSNVLIFGSAATTKNLIIKINPAGNTIWKRTYSFAPGRENEFTDAVECQDKGFATVGTFSVNEHHTTAIGFCMKLNSVGDTLWCRKFTDADYSSLSPEGVCEAKDSSIMICGTALNEGSTWRRAFIAHLSKQGTLLSFNTYTLSFYLSLATVIKPLNDSVFIMGGGMRGFGGRYCPFLSAVTKSGQILWSKGYCISNSASLDLHYASDLVIQNDGFAFSVASNSLCVIKTDLSGGVIWSKHYKTYFGESPRYERNLKLRQTSDSGFVVAIKVDLGMISNSAFVIDKQGALRWSWNTIFEKCDAVQLANKNFLIVMNPSSAVPRHSMPLFDDVFGIVITDTLGNAGAECLTRSIFTSTTIAVETNTFAFYPSPDAVAGAIKPTVGTMPLTALDKCVDFLPDGLSEVQKEKITIFPNPASNEITLLTEQVPGTKMKLHLIDVTGKIVFRTEFVSALENTISIPLLPSAVYFYFLQINDGVQSSGKLMIARD